MWNTVEIINFVKPKYVIWENVKNLLSDKHKHNFDSYIKIMNEYGYKSYFKVLNAKDYGIPQNRERIYVISILKDLKQGFTFPQKQELQTKLEDILEDNVNEKYYFKQNNLSTVRNKIDKYSNSNVIFSGTECVKVGDLDLNGFSIIKRVYSPKGLCPTLNAMQGGNRQPKILEEKTGLVRSLTPLECWRIMGFSDEDFNKASQLCSNIQLYKQAGNSIVVNVLEKIFEQLFINKSNVNYLF